MPVATQVVVVRILVHRTTTSPSLEYTKYFSRRQKCKKVCSEAFQSVRTCDVDDNILNHR